MLGAIIMKLKASSGFDYLNDRNLPSFLNDWDKNATFIYPGNISMSGEHHGIDNIKIWWEKFFVQFPESKFTCNNVFIKNCFAFGPSNEITLDWDVVSTNKVQKTFTNSGVSVVKLKKGKIIHFKDYFFNTESMAEAWGEEE